MTTQYWLVKQEPEKYAWEQFLRDQRTVWDGVRNYQARNNLQAMRAGDAVLFYASVGPKEIQGLATVSRTAFPDPTADDPTWVAVELQAAETLPHPVSLAAIKADPALAEIALLKQSRLSVMPLRRPEFERLLKLGGLSRKRSQSR